jgi:hypothetical protein
MYVQEYPLQHYLSEQIMRNHLKAH